MRRFCLSSLFVLLTVSIGFAQGTATPPPAASPVPATAAPPTDSASAPRHAIRGVFPLTPAKTLDSKKLKEGDAIVCTTTAPVRLGNGALIPTGAKVLGHVTVAKAQSKGDSGSSLGVTFDKIQISNGKEIAMKGTLLAVAPNPGGNSGPDTGVAGPQPGNWERLRADFHRERDQAGNRHPDVDPGGNTPAHAIRRNRCAVNGCARNAGQADGGSHSARQIFISREPAGCSVTLRSR